MRRAPNRLFWSLKSEHTPSQVCGWRVFVGSNIEKEKNCMCLGIPGQIVEIVDETFQIAKADVSGVKRSVSIALLAEEGIKPGDWVLIHVGFAMSRIDESEAQETMKLLQSMGEAYSDELKMLHQSQIE
jgi:hydrogenase expression/formation protein HypC